MRESGLIEYQLIRSNRKTLSLQIDKNSGLVVRSPLRLSIKKIEKFITQKITWITKKQDLIKSTKIEKSCYKSGEKFLYLGKKFPLVITNSAKSQLTFDGTCFQLSGEGKTQFAHWYKQQFINIARPRIDYYAQKYQLNFARVFFRSQKTLWGSCSSQNNISLNYLLIMTPLFVIDYVIIHELAHIQHKNHSSAFWALVKKMCSEYQQAKHYLKQNSGILHQFRI